MTDPKPIKQKVIAVDFDDTVVIHTIDEKYPAVGTTIPLAVETLKELVAAGHKLILWTVRDDDQNGLGLAVEWYKQQGIPLWGINHRPEPMEDGRLSESPKARANLYIDDAALGCPLIEVTGNLRPYVDWLAVRWKLVQMGYLPNPGFVK